MLFRSPVLAVTAVHGYSEIGHLKPQVIDRSVSPKDVFRRKVHLQPVRDNNDYWENEIKINAAILELTRHGGGPVHIDLPCTNKNYNFDVKILPEVKKINRYYFGQKLPELSEGRIAIFLGSHAPFSDRETAVMDAFCASHNAVVFCGHGSGYYGKYRVQSALAAAQKCEYEIFENISTLIHMGEATADEPTMGRMVRAAQGWRVNPDGELRDTFKKLTNVFEMPEAVFLDYYTKNDKAMVSYLKECHKTIHAIKAPIEELPFSNMFAAAMLSAKIPANSLVCLGVSNTIRAWSYFEFQEGVLTSSDVGCRGIDGTMSAFLGASFVERQRLCFCVIGDLSFFYDLNSLGNRFLGNNVRILLVHNNGGGVFKLSGAPGHQFFGDEDTGQFIAADGHFGNQSPTLVRNYAEDLGFKYMSAATKEDFLKVYEKFVEAGVSEKPMLFEIFTDDDKERKAFDMMNGIEMDLQNSIKAMAKRMFGEKGTSVVKNLTKINREEMI